MDDIEEITYDSDTEYDVIIDDGNTLSNNIEDIETFNKEYDKYKKNNITKPILNKYELTRVLSERTTQLDNAAIPFISNPERFTDPYSIALEELKQGKIPFIIRRPNPSVGYEYWKLKDMVY